MGNGGKIHQALLNTKTPELALTCTNVQNIRD